MIKSSTQNAISILILLGGGILLSTQQWLLQKDFDEFDTKYQLQVDSLSEVIEKYRIHKPDMVFMQLYYNMQMSNRRIDHILHVQELDIMDLKSCTDMLYHAEFDEPFKGWDNNIETDEFLETINDSTLISNNIR